MPTTALALAALAVATAQSPAAPIKLDLAPVDARGAVDAAHFQGGAIERRVEPRTAVEHRLAPDGVSGSAGYLCGLSGIGPDGDDARAGPASAFQHFGTFLGASLAVPIK